MKKLAPFFSVCAVVSVAVLACGDPPSKNNASPNSVTTVNNGTNGNSVTRTNSSQCGQGNVLATVNGETGCYTGCDTTADCPDESCIEGICIGEGNVINNATNGESNNIVVINNSQNNVNSQTTPMEGGACDTNADCVAGQECKDGTCLNHMTCGSSFSEGGCSGEWRECSDGKEYSGYCEYDIDIGYTCFCSVNGTVTAEFVLDEDGYSDCDRGPYRTFNQQCDWLLPEAF